MTRSIENVQKAKQTILVVDDEKDLVEMIAYNLQRNGYRVLTANSGDAALETAVRELPSLILLDLMLPGASGTEVARQLRARFPHRHYSDHHAHRQERRNRCGRRPDFGRG